MRNKKRFHLLNFGAKCELKQNESFSFGQLANISLNGAMISLRENPISLIQPGETCVLTVYPGDEETPFSLKAEVIHYAFSMAGVKFCAMDDAIYQQLVMLMEKVTQKPEHAGRSWHEVKCSGKSQPMQISH